MLIVDHSSDFTLTFLEFSLQHSCLVSNLLNHILFDGRCWSSLQNDISDSLVLLVDVLLQICNDLKKAFAIFVKVMDFCDEAFLLSAPVRPLLFIFAQKILVFVVFLSEHQFQFLADNMGNGGKLSLSLLISC